MTLLVASVNARWCRVGHAIILDSPARPGSGPPGDLEVGRQVGQRLQREAPLVQAWMRDAQARCVHDLGVVEQEVEVDRSRPLRHVSHPPEALLDREQAVE